MNKRVEIYSSFQPTFGNRPLQYIGRNDVIQHTGSGTMCNYTTIQTPCAI